MMKLHPLYVVLVLSATLSACVATKTATEVEKPDLALRIPGFPSPEFWYLTAGNPPLVSAHRGKPELPGYPENAKESLIRLIEQGSFIAELDVAMSKDSVLFLFHDDKLDRLTRHQGYAADRNWSDLDTMRLLDSEGVLTEFTIPTLREVLLAGKGKALFTLDRKKGVAYSLIQQEVINLNMLDDAAIILYNLDDFEEWKSLDVLGPVSFDASSLAVLQRQVKESLPLYKSKGAKSFKGRDRIPAIGFTGVGLPSKQVLAKAQFLRVKSATGTFRDLDESAQVDLGQTYRDLIDMGVSIVATDRPIAAYAALLDISSPKPVTPKTASPKVDMLQKKTLTKETVPAVVE